MQAQSLIQIRVDRSLKEEVSDIFSSLGMDISTAVRVFFQRCRAEKGIPFPLTLARPPSDPPPVRIGLAKGKWRLPKDWEKRDKAMDKEIEADFYAGSL
jgi:addiction module RelB/DinJ family antitoxin